MPSPRKTFTFRLNWIRRYARNVLVDLRYGGLLKGVIETRYRHLGAHWTENTAYEALDQIFENITIQPDDVLVDVGCGKGRVFNYWLSQGYRNRMIGLELDPDIADETRRRLRRHKNVTIIAGDAVENCPMDGTVFYMYSPFEAPIMTAFKDRLAAGAERKSDLRLLYYRPQFVHVFQDDPGWTVGPMHEIDDDAYDDTQLHVITMNPSV